MRFGIFWRNSLFAASVGAGMSPTFNSVVWHAAAWFCLMGTASHAQRAPTSDLVAEFGLKGQRALKDKDLLPHLALRIEPRLANRPQRKGFTIVLYRDNAVHAEWTDAGGRHKTLDVPMGHLYTLDIRHPDAIRKVFQMDTRGIRHSRGLTCEVNLPVRPNTRPLTWSQELAASMPLSVVWFDAERNLFDMNPYLHQQSVAEVKRQWSKR